ncbi:MAG: chemotaxis protein CheA [Myxococcaceae bacterium]|jgi:two-component system chemotaxis sensor kinase CheA|nr:chemotaxis protein CheA [Myxococcaceae bacterium]
MAPPRALSEFVAEANEVLETLAHDVAVLDAQRGREPEPDLLNAIFRAAHSLKGLSAMFGQERLAGLAHQLEDVLDALRLGKVAADDALLDALLEGVDVLTLMLGEAAGDERREDTTRRGAAAAEAFARLTAAGPRAGVDVLDEVGLDPAIRSVFTEYEEHRLRENVKKGVALWKVRAVFSLEDFDQRLSALNAALKPLGEVISTLPSSQPGDEASIAFDLIFGSARARADVEAVVQGAATVEPLTRPPPRPAGRSTPSPSPPRPRPAPRPPVFAPEVSAPQAAPLGGAGAMLGAEPSLRSLAQTVRVDIGRLDGLMNVIGELLTVRASIHRLAEVARQAGVTPLPKLWGQELQKEARSLERKLDELQAGILEVRMVPLGQVFDKLARLMRRLVRQSGKDVHFEVSGGDVELDKLIVEELSDPLMHLLRNALDHGVEAPDRRVARGKASRGLIRLKARQLGNRVQIEVGDDGAGMDESRIKQVAVERGLVSRETTEELERRDLLNLVFLPGFSTRNDVSELSGRGVGLDVVKTNLARLSGLIDIDSRRGEGTTFVLTLPLTLAIIRALVVGVADRTFAVPLNSVTEIVAVKPSELRTIERREVLEVRGQTLPFVRLSRVFGLHEVPVERHFVVVIGLAQERLGLAVDALLGQEDIVTKPLGGRLRGVPGIAGATELGDRRAVLVIDVGALVEELKRPQAAVG